MTNALIEECLVRPNLGMQLGIYNDHRYSIAQLRVMHNGYAELFERDDRRLRRAQAINHFIATSPRFVLEAGSVILIALIAIVIAARPGGLVAALPMLAAFAVGAQRLLPQAQQVYSAFTTLSGSHASLVDILELLDSPRQPELEPGADVPEIRFDSCEWVHMAGDSIGLGGKRQWPAARTGESPG